MEHIPNSRNESRNKIENVYGNSNNTNNNTNTDDKKIKNGALKFNSNTMQIYNSNINNQSNFYKYIIFNRTTQIL